jgi:hypothetical protein
MCNKNGDDGYLLLNNWDWDAEENNGDEDDTFVTNATSNDNDRIVSMDGWMDESIPFSYGLTKRKQLL